MTEFLKRKWKLFFTEAFSFNSWDLTINNTVYTGYRGIFWKYFTYNILSNNGLHVKIKIYWQWILRYIFYDFIYFYIIILLYKHDNGHHNISILPQKCHDNISWCWVNVIIFIDKIYSCNLDVYCSQQQNIYFAPNENQWWSYIRGVKYIFVGKNNKWSNRKYSYLFLQKR